MNNTTNQNVSKLVSVIVPAYNAADFLADNVTSYLKQTLRHIEIIIVNDGSKDNTRQIAEQLAKKDARIRVVNKENGGLSSARNAGVEAAKGEYLFFIDPDDYMEDDTLEVLFQSLEKSGSDVAVTGYDLEYPTETKLPGAWMQRLFSQSKQGFVVQEFPDILQASTAWGKLIRTSFYERAELLFIDGILYEDQPFTAKMYASASNGIDLIGAYKVHWVQRDASISHQVTIEDLQARLQSAQLTRDLLGAFSDASVQEARLVQNLNNDFRYIMRQFNKVSEAYNDLMFEVLPKFYALLPDKTALDAVVDVAYQLISQGKADVFERFLMATNVSNYKMKLVSDNGRPVIDWTPFAYLGEFKSEGHVLAENFQPKALISDFKLGENGIELDVQAFITKLDDQEFDYDVRLKLVRFDEKTGQDQEVVADLTPIKQYSDTSTIREHKEWWANYADNFYRFSLPNVFEQFNDTIKLQLDITAGNLHFVHEVNGVRGNGTGRWRNLTVSETAQVRLKNTTDKHHKQFYLKYVPIATFSVQDKKSNAVTFKVVAGSKLKKAEIVSIGHNPTRIPVKLTPLTEQNTYSVTINPNKLRRSNGILKDIMTMHRPKKKNWHFSFFNGNHNEILSFIDQPEPIILNDADVVVSDGPTGNATISVTPVVNVKKARIIDNMLHLDVQALNTADAGLDVALRLASGKAVVAQNVHLAADVVTKVSMPLTYEVFGERKPLPLAQYTVTFMMQNQREQNTVYEESLVKMLPINDYDAGIHVDRIDFNYSKQKLRIQLFNQMADDNKGGYGWGRMMSAYLNAKEPVDPKMVLFRTYYGESVTDNAVALTEEILKRPNNDLTLYWAVQNQHITVPEGTHQVIINSEEWFEVLAKAGTVVENVHQINYMDKKPGQRIVQAFHGYPYKQMGRTFYEDQAYNLARVKSFQDREAQWDFILSPAPYATPLYQDSFNFQGEILEVGHPRNDILVDPERATERAEINRLVRQRLNVSMDKKIVLYAPTYRDYASDTEFASHRVDFVDYNKLAKQLGDEYVLLIRGHMMNRRAGDTVDAGNVIDVTSYPEILDLIIASDMAVLDYSSLRFDYAQTGKPMIFLVPDLALYEETRGGLMPYLPTAPGWIVNTQQELVEAINDSDRYMTLYGDAWKTFRSAYTPMDDGKASQRMVDLLFNDTDTQK